MYKIARPKHSKVRNSRLEDYPIMTAAGIFVVLVVGLVCYEDVAADTCAQQFNGFRSCVRNQMSRDQNDATASESKRQQIQNDCTECASKNGCQNPYPPDNERQARQDCFNDARAQLRSQLQWCVQYRYREFELPGDDYDKDAYWNYLLLRTFAALKSLGDNRYNRNRNNKQQWDRAVGNQQSNDICGQNDDKKNQTLLCIKSKGTFNQTTAKSSWRRNSCRIKKQCNQVTQQCQQQWDDNYKPRVCDCVSTLKSNGSLNNIQNTYVECLRRRGIRNVDQNNDEGRQVIARQLNQWCASGKINRTQFNQTDPCRRRKGNGNGNGNNVNVQTQTQTNVDTGFDDGSSAQTANVNPVAGMLGDSDPLSSFGGGSLLGALGGGSPLLGGGGGSSPLANLGGGGLGNLFGGGLANLGGNGGGGLLSNLGGGGLGSGLLSGLGGDTSLNSASSLGAFGDGDVLSAFGGGGGNPLASMGGFGMKK